MKLTIGMPCYKNPLEVWMTVQALRMYQDLTDTEILVVDNFGSESIQRFVDNWCGGKARYVKSTEKQGTAAAKGQVFEAAFGEWVLVIDSHVMLTPGSIKRLRDWVSAHPDCNDLLHGPMFYDDLNSTVDAMNPTWGSNMWGQWRGANVQDEQDPYEIPMHGMGLFCCKKSAWLGFNPAFRGFGGEEGYIHEKFRQAGRRVLCLPWLKWLHHFRMDAAPPYPAYVEDQRHNYEVGFTELGLDKTEFYKHFNITG